MIDKKGYLRKSIKSQLGTELLKLCPLIDKKEPETSPQTHAIVIDFMALVRKVPLKKLDPPVKTFPIALTSGHNSDEIHIVFDTYREDSIKNGERDIRAKSKKLLSLNVPVVLENFWSSSTSKTAFQALYVEWLTMISSLYNLLYHHRHRECLLFSFLGSIAHMRKDGISCSGHHKSPIGTFIYNTVIRRYRCLCVPVIPLYSELERPRSARALAYP